MTVADLIRALQMCDPALPVVSGGFDESGFDYTGRVQIVELVKLAPASHCGDFEETKNLRTGPYARKIEGAPFNAVLVDV